MMPAHLEIGQKGEDAATLFLQEKGFDIAERNYRAKHSEIDIIAIKDNWLVFVEVKTRQNLAYGMPESFVSNQKARLICQAADYYIYAQNWHGNIRFDVISVIISNKSIEIEHFEDAFY